MIEKTLEWLGFVRETGRCSKEGEIESSEQLLVGRVRKKATFELIN